MLSPARSVADAQSAIVDKLVSDSVKFSGDAAKYARETTDALRDSVSSEQRGVDCLPSAHATALAPCRAACQ